MEQGMQNSESGKPLTLKVVEWHPYNEELRRKALLATLNAVAHEPASVGRCALDWIEDLQESIGHPMSAEQAVALYCAHLQVGIEPDYETWCETDSVLFEDPEVAVVRLRLQREVSEEFALASESDKAEGQEA